MLDCGAASGLVQFDRRLALAATSGLIVSARPAQRHEVLDAAHPGVGRIHDGDRLWHVSRKHEVMPPGLLDSGIVDLAGQPVVNLQEIDAAGNQGVDGAASLLGRVDHVLRAEPSSLRRFQERTGGDDPRRGQVLAGDAALAGQQLAEIASHVPHAGHAVGEKQLVHVHREVVVDAVVLEGMRVHLPQTRNQELAAAVEDPRSGWRIRPCGRTNRGDPVASHDDRLILDALAQIDIDHCHVVDDDDRCFLGNTLPDRRDKCSNPQQ